MYTESVLGSFYDRDQTEDGATAEAEGREESGDPDNPADGERKEGSGTGSQTRRDPPFRVGASSNTDKADG